MGLFDKKKPSEKKILESSKNIETEKKEIIENTDSESEAYRRYNDLNYLIWLKGIQWKIIIGLLACFIVQSLFFVYFVTDYSSIRIVHLTPDFRVVPVPTLKEPFISDDGLKKWSRRILTDTFSFSFYDWKSKFTQNQENYSADAYSELLKGIQPTIDEVDRTRGTVLAVASDEVRIIQRGESPTGKYVWEAQLPITLSIESPRARSQVNLLLTFRIERENPLKVASGLIISRINIQVR